MTTLRQAAEEALEALKRTHYLLISEKILDQERLNENFTAAEALRKALAEVEPEQEPVAIVNYSMGGIEWLDEPLSDDTPLYTAPPQKQWVGLTDEDMSKIFDKFDWKEIEIAGDYLDLPTFAKAIEAKLKEKNT